MSQILKSFLVVFVLTISINSNAIDSNESFFSKKQNFDQAGLEIYNSNLEMKKYKKIGIGASIGGASGVIGINTELNLDPENALVLGLGAGPSYGSFNALWKYNFEANYLSPYSKLGYSKWFSATNNTNNTTTAQSSDVLNRIFSEKDLKSGRFDADFVISSFGAEYNQLEGELSGFNFYGEIVLMTELKKFTMIPSGAVGMIYFY